MKAKELTYMERKLYAPKWHEAARAAAGLALLFLVIGIGGYVEVMM